MVNLILATLLVTVQKFENKGIFILKFYIIINKIIEKFKIKTKIMLTNKRNANFLQH